MTQAGPATPGIGQGPDAGQAAVFVDAWHARWPEWSVALAFVAPPLRARVAAWGALQQALSDAAWGGDDPTPGLAKLAWWQEELGGWARGARRHPLGALLQPLPAPWLALSRALPRLQATRLRPGEAAAPAAAWGDYAIVLGACDLSLFPVATDMQLAEPAAAATTALIVRALRGEQVLLGAAGGDGRVAAHGPGDAGRDAGAAASAAAAGVRPSAVRPRAIHAALVEARLRAAGAPLPAWRVPWLAWRAARNAR